MRVYLACTVRGDRAGVPAARLVAARLAAFGHDVLTSHLLADDVDAAEASQDERAVFERDLKWLDDCDVLIAEASGSTYGVGFEVGYLTGRSGQTGRRVYVLYDAGRKGAVSRMVSGYATAFGEAFGYRSLDELDAFIGERFGPRTR